MSKTVPAFKELKFQGQRPGGKWSQCSDKVILINHMRIQERLPGGGDIWAVWQSVGCGSGR